MKKTFLILITSFLVMTLTSCDLIYDLYFRKPEPYDYVCVEEIIFVEDEYGHYEYNLNYDKEIFTVTLDFDDFESDLISGSYVYIYKINYVVNPKEAKDKSVTFHPLDTSQEEFIEDISPEGLITFKFTGKFPKTIVIVARSADIKSMVESHLIINIKYPNYGIIE